MWGGLISIVKSSETGYLIGRCHGLGTFVTGSFLSTASSRPTSVKHWKSAVLLKRVNAAADCWRCMALTGKGTYSAQTIEFGFCGEQPWPSSWQQLRVLWAGESQLA